jgi:hypothetical protein
MSPRARVNVLDSYLRIFTITSTISLATFHRS